MILKGAIKNGYIEVCLYKQGTPYYKLAHRLVLETFVGPCSHKTQCNHKNGNKADNSTPNLEWVSRSENQRHAVRLGLISSGSDSYQSKLKEGEVWLIRKLLKENTQGKLIAKMFKVDPPIISYIKNGKTYKTWVHEYYPVMAESKTWVK